jgi:hypothetical protein
MDQTEGCGRVMLPDRFSLFLYRICVLGCLLGLAATVYLLSGWAGYVGSPIPNVALAGVLVFAGAYFLYIFFVLLLDRSRLGFLLWLSILLVLALEIALGLLPPTARDELTHHLAVPKLYASVGKIYEIPFDSPSYYPMLLEMLFTPWVKWRWDFIPKLIHGLFGFLTGVLLYLYLAHRLSPIYGLLGFLFFVSTPAVARLSNWAYVDLGLLFYSAASLLCLLQWIEARELPNPQSSIRDPRFRWLLLAGLSAGFAASTKPNGLLVLLLLFFVVAWNSAREPKNAVTVTFHSLTLFLLLALIPLSAWLVRNFVWTGNPFFPFFSSFFGAGRAEEARGTALSILTRRHLLYGESGWEIAALPLRIFFSGQDDNPQYFDGVLNPILILFLPWAFKGKWVKEKKTFFAFALLYFLFAVFLTDLRIRYLLPVVPPLVILLVYGIHNVYLRIVRPSLLFAALILLATLNGVYLSNYFHKVSPMAYFSGEETRDAYLTRMLPEYPALQFANHQLPAGARIYFIFMGRRVYYCDCAYFYDGDNPWVLLRMIQSAQSGDHIRARFVERGLTHLLLREELLRRFFDNNLTPLQQRVWDSFAMHHLRILYSDRGYSVYQIHG